MDAASSGVALGMTPGSLKLVRNNVDTTKMKLRPATTGITGETSTAKNRQLKQQGNHAHKDDPNGAHASTSTPILVWW